MYPADPPQGTVSSLCAHVEAERGPTEQGRDTQLPVPGSLEMSVCFSGTLELGPKLDRF